MGFGARKTSGFKLLNFMQVIWHFRVLSFFFRKMVMIQNDKTLIKIKLLPPQINMFKSTSFYTMSTYYKNTGKQWSNQPHITLISSRAKIHTQVCLILNLPQYQFSLLPSKSKHSCCSWEPPVTECLKCRVLREAISIAWVHVDSVLHWLPWHLTWYSLIQQLSTCQVPGSLLVLEWVFKMRGLFLRESGSLTGTRTSDVSRVLLTYLRTSCPFLHSPPRISQTKV